MRSFASDNNAGVHPRILAAMQAANEGHVVGYGDDSFTQEAIGRFRALFGQETAVFFVYGGTGANVVGLGSLVASYNSIICSENAHIHVDECGAPEVFTGCKLLAVPTPDGKLTPDLVRPHLHGFGFEHHAQPKVISISQVTEMGTLYTVAEIRALADLAHAHGMYLHMDGARIANAAAALGLDFRAFTRDAGVDVLSFGGAKNGMMYGEAVLIFDPARAANVPYLRKQATQLASKMRFIGAQFNALLSDNLWRENAAHANHMARLLADQVRNLSGVRITQAVQANGVFAILPAAAIPALQARYFFYIWNEPASEVRWMTSFDTTEADVMDFVATLRTVLTEHSQG